MENRSLEKAIDLIIEALDKSVIMQDDKVELMINLNTFLNKDTYRDNIKILQKSKKDV